MSGGAEKQPQEELRDELEAMGRAAVDLMEHLVRVPAALAQIPLQYLPEDTATHARNAAAEGFQAVKTLLDTISTEVDRLMREQGQRTGTRTGVGGETPSGGPTAGGEAMGGTGDTTRMGGSGATGSGQQPTVRLDDDTTH
jgi:hypothetical protein